MAPYKFFSKMLNKCYENELFFPKDKKFENVEKFKMLKIKKVKKKF
jgi:hypothetical protein